MLADYRQVYDPLGNSLGLSSIVAALPLVTLFVLLGVVRMRAWLASIIGLAVALIVAVAAYSMPVGDAVNSGLLGAAFGFFPIMWIVINAIWVYNLTVETGHFDVLRRSFASISDDQRIQAVIRVWHPTEGYVDTAGEAPAHREPAQHRRYASDNPGEGYPAAAASAPAASDSTVSDTRGDVFKAYAPYLIIIVIFVLATRVP